MLKRLTNLNIFLILLLTVSVCISGIAEANNAPTPVGTIPDQTLQFGGSNVKFNVKQYFSDPDGDTLSFKTYHRSNTTTVDIIATAAWNVTLKPKNGGTVTITLIASDPGGLTASQSFSVKVEKGPEASGTIPDGSPGIGGTAYSVDVSSYFTDANGDTLTYTASSADTTKATVSVSESTVTVTGVAVGTATITVTATDPGGLTGTQTFSVTVVQPNRAPTAVGTISNKTLRVRDNPISIDVSSNFSDADGDTLTYSASSSDSSIATVSMSSATATVTAISGGNATITVTATDPDGLTGTQTFSIHVPTPIPDQLLQLDGSGVSINLSLYFSWYLGFNLDATNTNSDVVGITLHRTDPPRISLTPKAAGTATITVTLNHNSKSFDVKVNKAPEANGTIPDGSPGIGGDAYSVDVSSYFTDANGDPLTYTAVSSDTTKATVSVSNSTVTVTGLVVGTATITVTATDPHNTSGTSTFTANVYQPNRAPVAEGTIADQKVKLSASTTTVDVSSYFSDADGDTLTYAVTSSDTGVATVSISNTTVTITLVATGTSAITVTATDPAGTSATQTFDAKVFDGPITVGTIPDKSLIAADGSDPNYIGSPVNLAAYFDAVDALTYTAVSSDTSKVTVSLSGTAVTLKPVSALSVGTATITVRATDPDAKYATQTFTVKVKGKPVPNGTIPSQTITIGGSSITINIGGYFIEPDGQTMTYTVNDSFLGGNEQVVYSISGNILTITPGSNPSTGTGIVTILAKDPDGLGGVQRFSLTVQSTTNNAPAASGTIPDSTKKVGHTAYSVDLSGYFSDDDGDTLTYTAISSDTTKATVSLSAATLTVTPVAAGTPTITATATDPSGAFATQSFTMTVRPANRAPVVSTEIPDQKIERRSGSGVTVDLPLGDYFSDADGDALTYTVKTTSGQHVVWAGFHPTRPSTTLSLVSMPTESPNDSGTTTVTVTATDTESESVSDSFTVTTSIPPTAVGTIPDVTVSPNGGSGTVALAGTFSDDDGDTLTYSASSSDTTKATTQIVSQPFFGVRIDGKNGGPVTVTVTATDPAGFTASHTIKVAVGNPPTTVGTIPNRTSKFGWGNINTDVSSYFNEPDGQALSYSASSSNTGVASVSVSGSTVTAKPQGTGNSTITVTASDPSGLTATQTFIVYILPGFADAIPGLSSEEQLLLGQLLTYDTIIFNELHNSSDDTNDWLELRNVSGADLPLDDWQLTVRTESGEAVIKFPAGTVIPAGDVLLLTNTAGGREQSSLLQEDGEMATADDMSVLSVVSEAFVLPQAAFALILRSPTVFGDIAGNYFEGDRPETAPAFTVDTAWDRTQPVAFGYRAEAWAKSTYQNGLGTPGYLLPSNRSDLNRDGVVNIFDLVLVASQFGTTSTTADLNGDGTVSMADLALVAGALGPAIGAPTASQSTAAVVNNWLKLARQNASNVVKTSIPEGFSYARGIQVLEDLARALTPDATALLANYPNPFNPETWIPYQLSKTADVTITIYASDGNVVRTLALGHRDAGMYKTRSQAAYWDGKNAFGESVASGVYFYTLTAGDFSATRKMLILK